MGNGTYPLRLDEEHRKLLEETSSAECVPMSQLIREGIEMRCAKGGTPSSVALREALAKLDEVSALLRSGDVRAAAGVPVQAPSDPVTPRNWSDFLDPGKS